MDILQSIRKYIGDKGTERLDIRAALIDMDGVLYDSMKMHTIAWHRLAGELGIDSQRDEFYLYEGMTGVATINLLYRRAFGKEVSEQEAKEIYARKTRYFAELGPVAMMPGAVDMLAVLRDSGITRVLVTGSGQHSILTRISHDYPGIFDDDKRVTAHDVTHGKPHPEPYLMGAKKAGVPPCQCMVIENAPLGVEAGKAAGCFTVGITTGPIPEASMLRAGADVVFPSMPVFAHALPQLLAAARDLSSYSL